MDWAGPPPEGWRMLSGGSPVSSLTSPTLRIPWILRRRITTEVTRKVSGLKWGTGWRNMPRDDVTVLYMMGLLILFLFILPTWSVYTPVYAPRSDNTWPEISLLFSMSDLQTSVSENKAIIWYLSHHGVWRGILLEVEWFSGEFLIICNMFLLILLYPGQHQFLPGSPTHYQWPAWCNCSVRSRVTAVPQTCLICLQWLVQSSVSCSTSYHPESSYCAVGSHGQGHGPPSGLYVQRGS